MTQKQENTMSENNSGGKCPVMHGSNTQEQGSVAAWWPENLNLDILHQQDKPDGRRL
jgi:catalase-peroxidase